MNAGPAIIVLAKAPQAGRVKTRCTPPCTPQQAADLATAALVDTLHAAAASSAQRVVIALDGPPGDWMSRPFQPRQFELVPQCRGSLGERIDHAFRTVGGPALLIGMDTPQVTVAQLDTGLTMLRSALADAVVGAAADGGFWCLGLTDATADVCAEVAMSRDDTHAQLRRSIARRGLTCAELEPLVDVDDFATALAVAGSVPGSRFAVTVAAIAGTLGLTAGVAGGGR